MKLTQEQWTFIQPLLPRPTLRQDRRGRPWRDPRDVLEGILWVLKTGARWKDLPPERYPPYQTCHRRFQKWVQSGVMKRILEKLVAHLQEKGKINLAETFIDATFVDAKKGVRKLARRSAEKAPKSWQSQTIEVFLSPYPLRVLHRMRVSWLKKQFGHAIAKTFLADLSETKLTIATHWMLDLQEAIASGSLLPISQIDDENQLRMDALYAATDDDGKWSDSSLGSNTFDA